MSGIRKWTSLAAMLVLITTLGSMAFARIGLPDKNSGTVHFTTAVRVGSTELPAGDYKVTWTGSGDGAQVTLKAGKNTTTVTAKVVAANNNADSYATNLENGSRVLTGLQFGKTSLLLNQAADESTGR